MAKRSAVFYPQRVNMYVPNMAFASDALYNQPNVLDFGAPAAIATLYTTVALTTGVAANFANLGLSVTDKWGRGLQIVASGVSTRTFTIRGRDYLGQAVRFDGALNGATAVDIPKALKYVDEIDLGASADTVTVTLKTSGKLGLPYATVAVIQSMENYAAATAGTLAQPVATQTATSSDPRGLWTPNGAVDGTRTFQIVAMFDFLNDNLHGAAHYYA